MTEPVLLVEKQGHVAIVTLNRPEAMNALSAELRVALGRAFRELQADPGIRVAIVTGAGRAFCAGMDLKELGSGGEGASGFDKSVEGQDMAVALAEFEGPVIAAVNGPAVTAGFELALACDMIIASSNARFADTHARVGILPGWGLGVRLPRRIGINRAREISFTGNAVSAEQACEWGLANRVVAPEELLPACIALAQQMASCVPEVLKGYKRLIDTCYAMPFDEALRYENEQAIASARAISSAAIAARREGVFERNRAQTARIEAGARHDD
ncbi:MAG: enoyl-CoA hydratase [Proteobacteria bacterium]|nr:enoyl-CoA hydratase [Pseudomonadota bacterium]HQR03362.1 enoyl-CoA hydratase [Rhodocyclaceae bacterium]